ncbi:SUMF1/EgtB/PvdO family nonheme iron enzyme [Occultella kanbiaonis]|uniref:SUMF1/EgtB/PvdO family nonheme iron enzyme n=1 Tax=Occultella kanbiaonis TaxID=2675754 RepID=UPI0013D4674D|nr:SUMF1/EgtB/PvdO family nonheme iron enzyme [Occultella kanbiaonis]
MGKKRQHSRAGLDWVRLSGGAFHMGSDDFYPDEAPQHRRTVAAFDVCAGPVTNDQFACFVSDTGYVSVAERTLSVEQFPHLRAEDREPGSLVFTPTSGPVDLRDWQQWWVWVPGACWQRPGGPGTTIQDKGTHPVVQVAYADAVAFAAWAGGRLPSEAEQEFAACGGVRPAPYAWGTEHAPDGRIMANTWHGRFPFRNDGAAAWVGTSAVGSFPPNGYGLYDCIGNVWEWSSDIYTPGHRLAAGHGDAANLSTTAGTGRDFEQPIPATAVGWTETRQRVLKGGSHLCAPEYSLRYRPAARVPQAEDSSTTHIGFRLARDPRRTQPCS